MLRVNAKKINMMISRDKHKKVTKEEKILFVVYTKYAGSNSTLCQFCICWLPKRCSGVRNSL